MAAAAPAPLNLGDFEELAPEVAASDRGLVDIDQWMTWFLGESESNLVKNKARFRNEAGDFVHKSGEPVYSSGLFEWPQLAELKERLDACGEGEERGSCPLTIIDGTDIGKHQAALRSSDKAMVQIASNFNCLENGWHTCRPEAGTLVTGYATDGTQGPAATFGVPAAALLRCHYLFEDRSRDESTWGQSQANSLNLLQDVAEYTGEPLVGKLRLRVWKTAVTAENFDQVVERVRVGVHHDCEVVFSRGPKGRNCLLALPPLQRPIVDQVLSAGVNWNNLEGCSEEQLLMLTRVMLRASYEGAYLAAIARDRELLVLTLIGGAAFRNPLDMILEELFRAHRLYASHPHSKLREVQLVIYQRNRKKEFEGYFRNLAEGKPSGAQSGADNPAVARLLALAPAASLAPARGSSKEAPAQAG